MTEYEFELTFALPSADDDGKHYLDALYEAGCDDALVGFGMRGQIGLSFTRAADSAEAAVNSAIANVKTAIPDAELIEAKPDLVSLTDIADIAQFSRQYARSISRGFPPPAVTGRKIQLWHLALVAGRFFQIPQPAAEVSRVNWKINRARDQDLFERLDTA